MSVTFYAFMITSIFRWELENNMMHHISLFIDFFAMFLEILQEHLIIVCELLRANLYEYQKYNKECGGEPYFTLNRLQVR